MGTSDNTRTFVKIDNITDFKDGEKKKIKIGDKEIMLARVGNNYYAVDNRCPHIGGDLSQGTLEGTIITCPRHRSQFDIADGKVIRWTNWSGPIKALAGAIKSPRPVVTYKTKVEGNEIYVEI